MSRHRPVVVLRPPLPPSASSQSDPLLFALVRYVEALHERYPDGPEQMRRERLDGRANITRMPPSRTRTRE